MKRWFFAAALAFGMSVGLPASVYADVFNGRIAFSSFRVDPPPGQPRTGDLFSVTPEATDLRRLTTNPADDGQADWSSDGTTIAYRIRKPDSRINFEVARMTAAGTDHTQLTHTPPGLASSQPSWAPDMRSIIYRRSGSGVESDVWTMGPLGENPTPLLALPGHQLYPSWSPDMTRLLFTTAVALTVNANRGVFTVRPGGSELTAVFDAPNTYDAAPAWSFDGSRIAFESNADPLGTNPERDMEIFVLNANGTNLRQLTRNTWHDEGPTWAPDGTMLAYSSGVTNASVDTHIMTAEGVHLRQLTDYEGRDESPDWQPIPAPLTDRRCGSLRTLEARDVRAAGHGLTCWHALALAQWWARARREQVGKFDATVADYGGTLRVTLADRGRPDLLVVFLAEPAVR